MRNIKTIKLLKKVNNKEEKPTVFIIETIQNSKYIGIFVLTKLKLQINNYNLLNYQILSISL